MSLQALVLCSDEMILRVLRRVLSDLEVKVEHCTERDAAIRKLTRDRFEAVIVDCADQDTAALVLKSARSAPCNRRAVAVAIIDGATAVRGAFELGAHFVLYKPMSSERAKTSFRAARALMKRERRRNTRVAVEIPVTFRFNDGASQQHATTIDLGEGGIAVKLPQRPRNSDSMSVRFADLELAVEGVVRVMHPEIGMGVEFTQTSAQQREHLEKFINALTSSKSSVPELMVEPEGLGTDEVTIQSSESSEFEDPLLDLFRKKADATPESFRAELRKQRGGGSASAASV